MSAIATLLARDGPPGERARPGRRHAVPRRAPRPRRGRSPPARPGPLPDTDAVVVSTATPADHPHVRGGARRAASRCVHRAAALAAICRGRDHGRGGRHPREDHHLGAARHPPQRRRASSPASSSAREVAGLGRNAAWGGAGSARRRGRRERRHLPRARRRRPRSSPTSSPTTSSTGAARPSCAPPSSGSWRRCAGRRCSAPTTRAPRRWPPTPPSPSPTAPPPAPTTGSATWPPRAPAVRFTLDHGGEAVAGRRRRPRPACTTPATPPRRSRWPTRLGVALADGRPGPRRRSEGWPGASRCAGEAAGVVLVDSYDHLPTEVAAALAAARAGDWARVVCCFQPHRYSRTEALGRSFADCFADADLLVVTEIYPAGEAPRPGVTGKIVVDAVLDAHPWKRVAWLPTPRRRRGVPRRHAPRPATSASPWAPATSPPSRPGCSSGSRRRRAA